MSNVEALVPKNKFDESTIEELQKLNDHEITPILLPLLEWIRDINWPVAQKIVPILAKHQVAVTPFIIELLKPEQTDEIWKYWIIAELLGLFQSENLQPVLPSLQRIAEHPTENERDEEVDVAARKVLRICF